MPGENRNIREKFLLVLPGPPQVPHGVCGIIAYVISAVEGLRLTV